MCGRFNQHVNPREWAAILGVARGFSDDWKPRYNIAPTQTVLCIRDSDQRELFPARWGLIPSWAKDLPVLDTYRNFLTMPPVEGKLVLQAIRTMEFAV